MSQPLVSVVVPSYNAESFIGATIQSVAKQTYPNWELIVVDDCSTDGTRDLVRALAVRDERIQLIPLKTNSNLPAVPRNEGIRRAKGELVAFLDHDDLWFRRKLERHVLAHQGNRELVMTHSALLNYPNRFDIWQIRLLPAPVRPMSSLDRLRAWNTVMCSSAVVQADVLTELGGFSERQDLRAVEDYELWIRIAEKNQVGYLPEVLGLYRISPTSTYQLEDMAQQLDALRTIRRIGSLNPERSFLRKTKSRSAWLPRALWNYAIRGPIRGQLRLEPIVH